MRIIFYTILVSFGVVLSVVILIPSFFDLNTYKTKLYKLIEDQTGYTLEIKGQISLSIIPRLSLTAENIILSNNKELLFKSKNLVVYPSVASFIKGKLYFESIKINKPLLIVKKYNEKSYNWTRNYNKLAVIEEEKQKNSSDTKVEDRKENKDKSFFIKNFDLKDASLTYYDLQKEYKLEAINLIFRENINSESFLKGSFTYGGYETKVDMYGKINRDLINFQGKVFSKFYSLEASGNYNYNKDDGKFNTTLFLKSKSLLSNYKNFKADDVKINADVILNKKILKVNKLQIYSHNNILDGNIRLNYGNKTKDVSVKISTDKLDLNKYYDFEYTFQKKKEIASKNNKKEKQINNSVSKKYVDPFKALEQINLNFSLKANQIEYKDLLVKNAIFALNKKKNINASIKAENFFNAKTHANLTLYDNMNFLSDIKVVDLSLIAINKYYGIDLIGGYINLSSNIKGKVISGKEIYKTLQGKSEVSSKEIIIKNVNFGAFKEDIKKIDNISKINQVKETFFKGNTVIKDQKIKLEHNKEIIKIPLTKIKLNEGYVVTSGEYNLENNNLNLLSNFESKDNKLLSLFNIETKGKISRPTTKITFDESSVVSIVEKAAEKKLKKVLEEKLERKFDNLLDKLLE